MAEAKTRAPAALAGGRAPAHRRASTPSCCAWSTSAPRWPAPSPRPRPRPATAGRFGLRPAREAEILRRLLAAERNAATPGLIVRIWRELIGDSLGRQGPFHLAVWGGRDPAAPSSWPACASAPRRRCAQVAKPEDALAAARTPGGVGVWRSTADSAWWGRLLAEPQLKVFAALPCLAAWGPMAALAVAEVDVEPTGDDRTFWVTDAPGPAAAIEEALSRDGVAAEPARRGRRAEALRAGRLLPGRRRAAGPRAGPAFRRDRGCAGAAGRVRRARPSQRHVPHARHRHPIAPARRARCPSPASSTSTPMCPARPRSRASPTRQAVVQREHPGLAARGRARPSRAAVDTLHLYPDGRATALRAAVAAHFGLEPERLVFGDGSDEMLHLINQVFLEPGDNIVRASTASPPIASARAACQARGARCARAGLPRSTSTRMLEQVDERTRLVFIANPATRPAPS